VVRQQLDAILQTSSLSSL
jgi:putative methionine-R-sulfoxide reductase with GAF domain